MRKEKFLIYKRTEEIAKDAVKDLKQSRISATQKEVFVEFYGTDLECAKALHMNNFEFWDAISEGWKKWYIKHERN